MNTLLDGKITKQQYEIIEEIGSGGFGRVYKATDKTNKRLVAIKIFQRLLGQDDSVSVDWEREAEHALALKSKNVIESYEFVQPTDDPTDDYYLVMEFANNGNLRSLIRDRKVKNNLFQETALFGIFRQMLLGLQAVHKSALHRDIKPENMLFVDDTIKLSDFGLAKHIDHATRTRTYKGWGTYIYMAPESWSLGAMTPATDIYSLGIVMYEALTLQLPFSSADIKELENLHKYGDRPRARAINSRISSKLDGIVYKMMMQSATSRYQSVDEILQELDNSSSTFILSPSLRNAVDLAQKIHTKKTQEEVDQQRRSDGMVERTKMNRVKVKEFVLTVQEAVNNFNQAVPESKLFLSKGSEDDYTLIWNKIDLLRMNKLRYICDIKVGH